MTLRSLYEKATGGEWCLRNHPERGGIWIDAPEEIVSNDRGPKFPRQILEDEDYEKKLADAALAILNYTIGEE